MSEKNNQERTSLQSKVQVSVEASVSSSINVSETSLPTATASGGEASVSAKSDIDTSSASTSRTATASGSVQSSDTEMSATAKTAVNSASSGLSKGDMWRLYELRIAARNYNYDNYNKWMNYFVLLIGAVFVAYTSGGVTGATRTILGILGYIFSVLWYLSNKGFYYWMKSYMSLVHKMEVAMFGLPSLKERTKQSCFDRLKSKFKRKEEEQLSTEVSTQGVYAVFVGKEEYDECCPLSSSNVSSSKVAILMSYLVAVAWFVELSRQCSYLESLADTIHYTVSILGGLLVTWGLGLLGRRFLASDMSSLIDVTELGK